MTQLSDPTKNPLQRILKWTQRIVVLEQIWPSAIAVFFVALGFSGLALSGVLSSAHDALKLMVLIGFVAALLLALKPLLKFSRSSEGGARRRLEKDNALTHRPLSAISDEPVPTSGDSAESDILWALHLKQMQKSAEQTRLPKPQLAFFRIDPYALRVFAAVIFVIGLAMGWSAPISNIKSSISVADIFQPHVPTGRFDAWIKPPAYRQAKLIPLTSTKAPSTEPSTIARTDNNPLRIHQGSEITFQSNGEVSEILTIEIDSGETKESLTFIDRDGKPVPSLKKIISDNATITVRQDDDVRWQWSFDVIANIAPTALFTDDVAKTDRNALALRYEVSDDHAVRTAHLTFKAAQNAQDLPGEPKPLFKLPDLRLKIPSRRSQTKSALTIRDLSADPWAGNLVEVEIIARDFADLVGRSERRTIRLPTRRFDRPLAAALVEQRAKLARDARNAPAILETLNILLQGSDLFLDTGHFLGLNQIRLQLTAAETEEDLRDVTDALWQLALSIESGSVGDALSALRDAQKALREAIEQGADQDEIKRLAQEMREAMKRYMQALAKQQNNQQQSQNQNNNATTMSQQDLDRMLKRVEELTKQGRHEEAARMLERLQQTMENMQMPRLQNSQRQDGQQGNQQQQDGGELGRMVDELGKMIRRQRSLMEETDAMRRRRSNQDGGQQGSMGQQGQQGLQSTPQGQGDQATGQGEGIDQRHGDQAGRAEGGESGGMGNGGNGEEGRRPGEGQNGQNGAERQNQLLSDLEQLMQEMRSGGLGSNDSLNDARERMGEARDLLEFGENDGAANAQSNALQSLRDGADALARSLEQSARSNQRNGQHNQGPSRRRAGSDPLGRGTNYDDRASRLRGDLDGQLVDRIIKELRRKLGDSERTKPEKDYLQRLLDGNGFFTPN